MLILIGVSSIQKPIPSSRLPISSDIERFKRNLRDELDGSALYAAMSAAEPDPVRNVPITGKSPVGNTYTGGVDPQIAQFLQAVAWETVREYYAPAKGGSEATSRAQRPAT